ncbi:MAG: hypothetical protein F6K42_01855 [Leptolyngbya sp. SIO1D8]|nr:hypothetical protein [Leptolyngbya sp. SIO1D8]
MEPNLILTTLILNHPRRSLGSISLDWMPQPGARLIYNDQAYMVLERRHCYQFMANRYQLQKIELSVQAVDVSEEKSLVNNQWILGDATCRYNAHSEILRCAVNPQGSCCDCHHYKPRES